MAAPDARLARTLWQLLEPIHAVVYFAPEVGHAYKEAGLKGFWMGYFAGRAAPLGPASPELVAATFFNFRLSMVQRSLPDAWALASPDDVLAARQRGVDQALAAAFQNVDDADALADAAAEGIRTAMDSASLAGRPLFAAYRSLPWPESPRLRLWHAATLLREHRGEGHVAANVARGFDGLAAHVMMVGTGAVPRQSIQPHRGWTDDEWDAAAARLVADGLLDKLGALTGEGRDERQRVEDATDELASEPLAHIGSAGTDDLRRHVEPLTQAVLDAGIIPFPNPMGLPGRSQGA